MRVISVIVSGLLITLVGGAQKSQSSLHSGDSFVDLTGCTTGINYQYYEVSGKDHREVRGQLLEKGPVDQKGDRRFAFAAWTLEWDWPVDSDGTRRYSETKVRCNAQLLLPKFRAQVESKEGFNQEIERVFEKIHTHEMHHVQHAIEGAYLLRKAIVTAAQEGRIRREKHANKVAFKVIDKVRAFDVTYDQMTQYGETEGTWLR